jgi:integrase/recombinase XerD
MEIDRVIDGAISYLDNLNYSSSTTNGYYERLNLFSCYLEENSISSIEEISYKTIQEYLAFLRTRPRMDGKPGTISPATINSHIKALKAMYMFLEESEGFKRNPTKNIKKLAERETIIESFTEEQAQKLLAVPGQHTFVGRRDRLLILLLLDTGLRISEALGQRVNTIDFSQHLLKVHGKGKKDRLVPFGNRLGESLKSWIDEKQLGDTSHIFFGEYTQRVITSAAVRMNFKKYGKIAEIANTPVRPHVFRHTFALFFLRNGGNPFVLQRIMGHSTLDMTKKYIHMLVEDLQRQHTVYGPGDNLLGTPTHTVV